MPGRMQIASSGDDYTIRIVDRGGLDAKSWQTLLTKVFRDVNRAGRMPNGAAGYSEAYNLGPLLFDVMLKVVGGPGTVSELGGLTVSATMLGATVAKLRELGVVVDNASSV